MGEIIQFISIFIEFVIVIFGILIALQRKKIYGFGIAFTFAVYVFYDLIRLFSLGVSESLLYGLFFAATASALFVTLNLYHEGKKKRW